MHDKLYETLPPGLNPEKGDVLDLPTKNSLGSIRQKALALGGRLAKRSLDRINAMPIGMPDRRFSCAIAAGLARSALQYCMAASDPYSYAIVDSGASYTCASGRESLQNTSQGLGHVRVANGASEKVGLIGDMGPLKGVRQVSSFQRTLVSVKDLVEQFGPVLFNNEGVYLASRGTKDQSFITKIGSCTPERFCTFDVSALTSHNSRVRALLACAA